MKRAITLIWILLSASPSFAQDLFLTNARITDLASRLAILPILNDSGRWQIRFSADLSQEIVSDLYLRVGILEYFDSKPPAGTNRNDFSITTSLGWTFF